MEVIKFVVTIIFGGVAGALVNIFATRRRQRVEVTLRVIEQFVPMHSEFADVLGILESPASLNEALNYNRVTKMGNWFDYVSVLCDKNVVDATLLKEIGMIEFMKGFQRRAGNSNKLDNELRLWSNMRKLLS